MKTLIRSIAQRDRMNTGRQHQLARFHHQNDHNILILYFPAYVPALDSMRAISPKIPQYRHCLLLSSIPTGVYAQQPLGGLAALE
jgi:hypothetical protein